MARYRKYGERRMTLATKNPMMIGGTMTREISKVALRAEYIVIKKII